MAKKPRKQYVSQKASNERQKEALKRTRNGEGLSEKDSPIFNSILERNRLQNEKLVNIRKNLKNSFVLNQEERKMYDSYVAAYTKSNHNLNSIMVKAKMETVS